MGAEKFCDRYRTRVGGLGLLGGEVGEGEKEGEKYQDENCEEFFQITPPLSINSFISASLGTV